MTKLTRILPIVTFLTFSVSAFASEEFKGKSKASISPIILPISSSPKTGSPIDSPTILLFRLTPTFGSNRGTPITVETSSDSTIGDLTNKASILLQTQDTFSIYCPSLRSPKPSYKSNSITPTPIVSVSGITPESNVTILKNAPHIYVVKASAFTSIEKNK